MIKYKNEVVEMPVRFTSLINEKKVSELNELFNQRMAEGLELEAHTYLGDQSGSTNAMFITFKTANEAMPSFAYKSEVVEVSTKLGKLIINEKELSKLNELFRQRMAEGWELAAHTFLSAGGAQANVMFLTFKKATAFSREKSACRQTDTAI